MSKRFKIGCVIVAVSLGICITVFALKLWLNIPYFERFHSPEGVHDHLVEILSLNETTFNQLQRLIERNAFGVMDCEFSSSSGEALICDAPEGGWSFAYYRIRFEFENNVLVDIEVQTLYDG